MGDLQFFTRMKALSGLAPRVVSRHDLMKVLYEGFPNENQQSILSNKKISDIKPTTGGVFVSCADGSSYQGSIVIGANGAHRMVRDIMRNFTLDAGTTEVNAESPFTTTYRALWVRFPRSASTPDGMTCETHGRNAATQLFVGEISGVVAIYERLQKPTRERARYTQADQGALVEDWGHLVLTPNSRLTLRDVYESRLESGLVSLEEGTLDHWSWDGRIVLAGDAAHKFTPSTGAGCNNGMVDIVSLVNELQTACGTSQNSGPDLSALQTAFIAYQTFRQRAVASECARASQATAMATWQSTALKFVDQRVMVFHMVQNAPIKGGAQSHIPDFHFTRNAISLSGMPTCASATLMPVLRDVDSRF